LPQARFVVLDAPDLVRVQRLLGRSDRFDQISSNGAINPSATGQNSLAAVGVADGDTLFTPDEVQALLQSAAPPVGAGSIAVEELRAKLQIVVEERRNYDPQAAIAYLKAHVPDRTLLIDTTQVAAAAAAQQVVDWLL